MSQLVHNSNLSTPHSLRSRRGISIIEVMTAVVVAMIGVFGTLVLIPFAIKQAQSGLDLDDGRNLAVNSIASFDAMGFDDQDRWAAGLSNTSLGTGPLVLQRFSSASLGGPRFIDPLWINANLPLPIPAGPSLDSNLGPRAAATETVDIDNNFGFLGDGVLATDPDSGPMTARTFKNDGTNPGAYPFFGQVHPALPAALRISRVSLMNEARTILMNDALAQRLFQSTDALSFSKFDAEETGPNGEPLSGQPFQIFDRDGTGNILRRQTTGGRLSQAMFIIPGEGQLGGVYRRVTLIFADRDVTLYSDPGGTRPTDPDDLLNVNPRAIMASALVTTRTGGSLSGLQRSGREIVLCKVDWSGGGDPTWNTIYLDFEGTPEAPGVRRDDWVMMINLLPLNYPTAGQPARQQVQFFRVSNIDEGEGILNTNVAPRNLPSLTLDGPSFDFGPAAGPPPTYIIHLRDVVNIYEDTISL